MSESTGQNENEQSTISEIWGFSKPEGRFNDWGERKWITATEDKQNAVDKELSGTQLSFRAESLFLAAKLTDSIGVEFVVISNVQFPKPLKFGDPEIIIVPCFKPVVPPKNTDVSDRRQSAMLKQGKFIYDGWAPLTSWSEKTVEDIVKFLDGISSILSLIGNFKVFWEPKYMARVSLTKFYTLRRNEFESVGATVRLLEGLPAEDKLALQRSATWLATAIGVESFIQRYLLLFLSLESIIYYIEEQAKSTSPLRRFSQDKLSKSERRKLREMCIEEFLNSDVSLREAVESAYFDCLKSVTSRLKNHLKRFFVNGDEVVNRLFEDKVNGKTMWQIRNDIAHGSLNLMSDDETRIVEQRIGWLEYLCRVYLQRILSSIAHSDMFPHPQEPGLVWDPSQGFGTPGTEYVGATEMAEYYLYSGGVWETHVSFTGTDEKTTGFFSGRL